MKSFLITLLLSFNLTNNIHTFAAEQPETTTIYLVRHTEKALDVKQDPPLTQTGIARAHYWASVLQEVKFDAVYSTDTTRTRDTAKPLAEANKQAIELYHPNDLTRTSLLEKHAGGNVLIVGHSNTTPGLVNQLLQKEIYKDLNEKDYSSLFIVSIFGDSASAQKLNIDLPKSKVP